MCQGVIAKFPFSFTVATGPALARHAAVAVLRAAGPPFPCVDKEEPEPCLPLLPLPLAPLSFPRTEEP